MGYGFGAFLLMLSLIMIGVLVAVVGLMLLVIVAITWIRGRRSRAAPRPTLMRLTPSAKIASTASEPGCNWSPVRGAHGRLVEVELEDGWTNASTDAPLAITSGSGDRHANW